jgi:hypothetical protein
MSIMQVIGKLNRNVELSAQARDFAMMARFLLAAKGNLRDAATIATEQRASPRVVTTLKAAVAAGSFGSWGAQLADAPLLASGFVASLANVGVFDAMLASMRPMSLSSTGGAVANGAVGYTIAEGNSKPISNLSLTSTPFDPIKALGQVVGTVELMRFGVGAEDIFARELRYAVAKATDVKFLDVLLSGVTPATSVGATAISVRNDIAAMLALVPTDMTSRLFIVTTPLVCKMWSMMGATATNASPAFERMTPQGGEISGITVLPSDAPAAGLVVLVDAGGLGGAAGDVVIGSSTQSVLQMESSPDSPVTSSTVYHNLWQMGMLALKAERYFAVRKLRATPVAAVSNANSYQAGFSPP